MNARRSADPWQAPAIDWDATLRFRHHLWSLGFAVAEAMDTSQRGMGLDWPGAKELIRRALAEARTVEGARIACGAGTDQLDPAEPHTLDDVAAAYEEQLAHVEAHGGTAILMASRALCRIARSPDDYLRVYAGLIGQARDKVILHWLGEAFDPQLAGYWSSADVAAAAETVLSLVDAHRDRIDGIKISLLDPALELSLRSRLPYGVKMYTGDDFNYVEMIEGDGSRFSHGLLGIFDAIAPAAAAAFARLDAGDAAGFRSILAPTVPLSRRIFEAPTRFYKAGIRVPGLAQRPPGPFSPARRPRIGTRHPALRGPVPAGRPRRPVARPRPRRRPHARPRDNPRHRLGARRSPHPTEREIPPSSSRFRRERECSRPLRAHPHPLPVRPRRGRRDRRRSAPGQA